MATKAPAKTHATKAAPKAAPKAAKKPAATAVPKTAPATERKKSSPLHADVFAADGSAKGQEALPKTLFDGTPNKDLLAQAVRVFRANQREGSAKTKTRGEVEGSTRKIFRQKGTGRARHGSIRAPIFVGGGIAFGPVPRDYRMGLNKKMKRAALIAALTARRGDIGLVDGLETASKTKEVAKAFAGMKLTGSILLVVGQKADTLVRAARNIGTVDIIRSHEINPYAVLTHRHIVFTKDALAESTKHFTNE